MAVATDGDTVRIHYTGRLDDGTVFDSSEGRDPLQFVVGSGQVIAGFDQAVAGMETGEEKTVTIPADQAYGPHREDLLFSMGRSEIPAGVEPQVGHRLEMSTQDGRSFRVVVREADDSKVVLDANHPLAGQDLTFDIHLVATG
jgi:peptidylprolyl isomerase